MRSFWLIPILCAAACAAPRMAARTDLAPPPTEVAPVIPVETSTAVPVTYKKEPARSRPSTGERIARRAGELVGRDSVSDIAPGYQDDCSGFVRLVYAIQGIDLSRLPARSSIVQAMYIRARENGALRDGSPRPGDLVFFRNTYDRNRDGRRHDGLTHAGIVESVDDEGPATFVHRGGRRTVRPHLHLDGPRQFRARGHPQNGE